MSASVLGTFGVVTITDSDLWTTITTGGGVLQTHPTEVVAAPIPASNDAHNTRTVALAAVFSILGAVLIVAVLLMWTRLRARRALIRQRRSWGMARGSWAADRKEGEQGSGFNFDVKAPTPISPVHKSSFS